MERSQGCLILFAGSLEPEKLFRSTDPPGGVFFPIEPGKIQFYMSVSEGRWSFSSVGIFPFSLVIFSTRCLSVFMSVLAVGGHHFKYFCYSGHKLLLTFSQGVYGLLQTTHSSVHDLVLILLRQWACCRSRLQRKIAIGPIFFPGSAYVDCLAFLSIFWFLFEGNRASIVDTTKLWYHLMWTKEHKHKRIDIWLLRGSLDLQNTITCIVQNNNRCFIHSSFSLNRVIQLHLERRPIRSSHLQHLVLVRKDPYQV